MIYILFTATFLYCNLFLQKGTLGLRIRQSDVSVLFDPLKLQFPLAGQGNSYPHLVALLPLYRLLPIPQLFDFDGFPLLHPYNFILSMEIQYYVATESPFFSHFANCLLSVVYPWVPIFAVLFGVQKDLLSMMTHYCQSRPSYKFVSSSNFIISLLSLIDSRSFLKIFYKVSYGIIKQTMGNLLLNSLYAIVSSLGISYNVFCSHFSLSTSSQPLLLTTHPTWCLLFVFLFIYFPICANQIVLSVWRFTGVCST